VIDISHANNGLYVCFYSYQYVPYNFTENRYMNVNALILAYSQMMNIKMIVMNGEELRKNIRALSRCEPGRT